MADYEINDRVDITDVVCPMTFVKAKVAMEELEIGQVLAFMRGDLLFVFNFSPTKSQCR